MSENATSINVSVGGVVFASSNVGRDLVDLTTGSDEDVGVGDGNIMAGQFDFLNPLAVTPASREETSNNTGVDSCTEVVPLVAEADQQTSDFAAGTDTVKRQREDDMQCMICLEPWTNSGDHRIVSLACGHVFGNSCISKWLGERKFCPSCNKPAKRGHIRAIFVSTLVAMDTAERDRAVAEMVKERETRRRVESQRARAEQALMQLARSNESLQSEMKSLKSQIAVLKAGSRQHAASNPETVHRPAASQEPQSRGCSQGEGRVRSGYRYLKSFHVQGARVLDFSLPLASVLVSSCADHASHSLTKINFLSGATEVLPTMHSKPIRDCRVDPWEGETVLTCSIDKTVRVTSIASNNCVVEYKVDKELWSCAWHPSNQSVFLCGGAQNSLFLFDLLDTSGPKLILRGVKPPPTHSLVVAERPDGGTDVVGGTMGGLCVWHIPPGDVDAGDVVCRALSLPARLCTCVCANAEATRCVASFRGGALASEGPMHIEFKFPAGGDGGSGDEQCEVLSTLRGHSSANVLSRTALIHPKAEKAEANADGKTVVASGNEGSMESWLWDADATEMQPHRLYPHPSPVFDTQARGHLLGSLSESRLYVYEFACEQ